MRMSNNSLTFYLECEFFFKLTSSSPKFLFMLKINFFTVMLFYLNFSILVNSSVLKTDE